jgi:hypothetical protein
LALPCPRPLLSNLTRRSETEVFTSKRRSFFQSSAEGGGSLGSPAGPGGLHQPEEGSPEEEGEVGLTLSISCA